MNRQTTLEKIFYFFITKIIFGIAVIAALVALIEQDGRPLLDRTSLSGNAKNIIISLANSAIALTAYILLFRFYEKRKITELRISSFVTNAAAGFAAGFALQAIFILVIYFAGGYEVIKINPASFILPAFGYALTAGFVAEVEVIGRRVIKIDCAFDEPKAEDSRVEIEISLRVAGDTGDVMDTSSPESHRVIRRARCFG